MKPTLVAREEALLRAVPAAPRQAALAEARGSGVRADRQRLVAPEPVVLQAAERRPEAPEWPARAGVAANPLSSVRVR